MIFFPLMIIILNAFQHTLKWQSFALQSYALYLYFNGISFFFFFAKQIHYQNLRKVTVSVQSHCFEVMILGSHQGNCMHCITYPHKKKKINKSGLNETRYISMHFQGRQIIEKAEFVLILTIIFNEKR